MALPIAATIVYERSHASSHQSIGSKSSNNTGVWARHHTIPSQTPLNLWGASAVTFDADSALIFGGESTLGIAHHRTNHLWALNLSTLSFRSVAVRGVAPASRRQHAVATLTDDEMLAVGGQGENGQPLGDAWSFSAGSATWHASGLEGEYAAALARAGHTLTPLPPAPYLFGPHDGAYLLFGGLSTPRVARLARFTPHSPEAYADAAADDAAEPDASPIALNDLLLLTRGARKAWSLTRLSLPDACSCRAHPISVNNKRSVKRSQSASALLPADDLDDYEDDDVKPLSEREVEMQLLGSQQKGSLSEEEAAALQASAVPRAHRPCGRYGHSAHLYVGEIGSSWSSSNTSLLEDQPCGGDGCLLIHAGAANAEHAHTRGTLRLDDLWILPLDGSWSRTRDTPKVPKALPWRALRVQPIIGSGASYPPRASHVAFLRGEWLYTLGGEAPRSPFAPLQASVSPLEERTMIWSLHLPTLTWTPTYPGTSASLTDGLPRVARVRKALFGSNTHAVSWRR